MHGGPRTPYAFDVCLVYSKRPAEPSWKMMPNAAREDAPCALSVDGAVMSGVPR